MIIQLWLRNDVWNKNPWTMHWEYRLCKLPHAVVAAVCRTRKEESQRISVRIQTPTPLKTFQNTQSPSLTCIMRCKIRLNKRAVWDLCSTWDAGRWVSILIPAKDHEPAALRQQQPGPSPAPPSCTAISAPLQQWSNQSDNTRLVSPKYRAIRN